QDRAAGHFVEHTGSTAHADIDQFPDGVERLLIDLHYTFPVQSTCCTILERLSFFTGLFITPAAPRARHLFFVAVWISEVRIRTGMVTPAVFASRRNAKPSRSGMSRSVIIRSGFSRTAVYRPSRPFTAVRTV